MRSSVGARRVAALEPSHRFEHLLPQFADASASADRTAGIFFVFFTGVGVVRQILQRFFGLLPRHMLARLGRPPETGTASCRESGVRPCTPRWPPNNYTNN